MCQLGEPRVPFVRFVIAFIERLNFVHPVIGSARVTLERHTCIDTLRESFLLCFVFFFLFSHPLFFLITIGWCCIQSDFERSKEPVSEGAAILAHRKSKIEAMSKVSDALADLRSHRHTDDHADHTPAWKSVRSLVSHGKLTDMPLSEPTPALSPMATLSETQDIEHWTTSDVCAWLVAKSFGQYQSLFRKAAITGKTLLSMESHTLSTLGIKVRVINELILRFIFGGSSAAVIL